MAVQPARPRLHSASRRPTDWHAAQRATDPLEACIESIGASAEGETPRSSSHPPFALIR
jgi:hypothetical protein